MDRFEAYSMGLHEAKENPDLLSQVAGVKLSITALTLEFTLTNKGAAVIISGNGHTNGLLDKLGKPFEGWVTNTAQSVGMSEVVQNANAELSKIVAAAIFKGGDFDG